MLDDPNAFLSKLQSHPPHGMTFRKLLGLRPICCSLLADTSDGQTMAVKGLRILVCCRSTGREVQA